MGSFLLSVDEVHAAIRRRLGPGDDAPIVWEDGPDALEIRPDSLRVEVDAGWLHVSLWTRCDERGEAPLGVAFFLGRPGEGDGAEAAAAVDPDVEPALAARFGGALQSAVWSGLLDGMEARLERAAGAGRPQAVRGFTAGEGGVQVVTAELEG